MNRHKGRFYHPSREIGVGVLDENDPGSGWLTMIDLMADQTPVRWLIDGLLPASGLSLLFADPGAGKSTLVRTLVKCVVRGDDFLSRKTAQGKVLYLALEDIREFLRDQLTGLGLDGSDADMLRVWNDPVPANPEAWITREVTLHRPALVVIDTMNEYLQEEFLNDYGPMGKRLRPLRILARQLGTHIMLTHHTRKDGEEIMGSHQIRGAVDTAFLIRATNQGHTITREKGRYKNRLDRGLDTATPLKEDPITGEITLRNPHAAQNAAAPRTLSKEEKLVIAEAAIEQVLREQGPMMKSPALDAVREQSSIECSDEILRKAWSNLDTKGRLKSVNGKTGYGAKLVIIEVTTESAAEEDTESAENSPPELAA